MSRAWIAVASADHVRLGQRLGIMQVCHGKAAPLRRIAPGDRVIYYAPVERRGDRDRLQAFTAHGAVRDGVPYQVDMGAGFKPWRRDVAWHASTDAPIRPLLEALAFTRDNPNWGYQFRFGLFAICSADADTITAAMAVTARSPTA